MRWFKSSLLALLALGALAQVTSCGGRSSNTGTDSNTHWLRDCRFDDECGPLSCLCGVCSRACDDARDCAAFGPGAACEVPLGCAASSGPPACVQAGGGGGSAGRASGGSGGASAGTAGSVGGTSGSVMGGTSSGGSGPLPDPACRAMDARTGGLDCASIVGYAFDGGVCAPIFCSCVGSECGEVFETLAACDRAYSACYEARGVPRSCETHADCELLPRRCCSPCGAPGVSDMIAVRAGTPVNALQKAGICLGEPDSCPDCLSADNPALYAACVQGQCQAFELGGAATCERDDDCSLRHKDCCGCREVTAPDLVAANSTFFRPDYCPLAMSCVACNPPVLAEDAVAARCNLQHGVCELSR